MNKQVIYVLLLLIGASGFAQDNFTQEQAQGVVDTFFEGFHKGDSTMMRSVMAPNMISQTVFSDKQGNHRLVEGSPDEFLKAIADRPADQVWKEMLLSYEVQIDGNLANVWTPYEFYLNENFSHCGANQFTLARTNEGWKIVHLIDSRRRSSCKD